MKKYKHSEPLQVARHIASDYVDAHARLAEFLGELPYGKQFDSVVKECEQVERLAAVWLEVARILEEGQI